jgi:inner membrane protein
LDSLTQIVLGGSIAAIAVPAGHRRRAAVAGAVLATLPDLDGLPLAAIGADIVTAVTWHRGPSHSLPVLALFGWLVWLLLRRWWTPVREQPRPWLIAIQLALLTHPLLDAFTVYGTQLLWPLQFNPVMWSSVFIIDPGYTLPLLVSFIAILVVGAKPSGKRFLVAGLALSTAYLGWSLAAKALVDHAATEALAAQGLRDAPRFSVPMPLNTVLWRVVVMTPDGFLEGYRSVLADSGPMTFTKHASDTAALAALRDAPAVKRLLWFTSGFMKAEAAGGRLVLSDLRMGAEPDYTFRYDVARRSASGQWEPVPAKAVPGSRNAKEQLSWLWRRIRDESTPPFSSISTTPRSAP